MTEKERLYQELVQVERIGTIDIEEIQDKFEGLELGKCTTCAVVRFALPELMIGTFLILLSGELRVVKNVQVMKFLVVKEIVHIAWKRTYLKKTARSALLIHLKLKTLIFPMLLPKRKSNLMLQTMKLLQMKEKIKRTNLQIRHLNKTEIGPFRSLMVPRHINDLTIQILL